MTLDLVSVVVGGVLWEVISAYIHFVAGPRFKRYQARKKGLADDRKQQQIHEDYSSTAMGFNCQLKGQR